MYCPDCLLILVKWDIQQKRVEKKGWGRRTVSLIIFHGYIKKNKYVKGGGPKVLSHILVAQTSNNLGISVR